MRLSLLVLIFVICKGSWSFSQEPSAISPENSYLSQKADLDRFADLKNPHFKDDGHYSVSVREGQKIFNWQFPSEMIHDADLGYLPNPNSQIRHIMRTEHETVFDAMYSFDQYSRRVTPVKKTKSYDKFIALFGCSFTYGNGLNDNQTINYGIAKQNKEFYPYNYAIGASGINSTLALVQRTDFASQIPEKKGLFVEVYITAHVERAVGTLPSLSWLADTPYFKVTADDQVERQGTFNTGRPVYSFFMSWIYRLFGQNVLSGRVFPRLTKSDFEYYCRLVVEVRDTLKKKLPESKFVLYTHPIDYMNPDLEPCLAAHDIRVMIPPHIESADYRIKLDGHPNDKMNQLIAADIVAYAKKEFAAAPPTQK